MALARIGDFSRANALADELQKTHPQDTLLQFYSLPSIRAAAELSRGNAAKAEDFTERARPYELASPSTPPTDLRPLYPSYLRGQAYLAMHRGNDAAVEFQRILDHRGLNGNSPLGALAHLQIGRAYALSGDPAKARAAYQDFFALWKDADPDIPDPEASQSGVREAAVAVDSRKQSSMLFTVHRLVAQAGSSMNASPRF